MFHAPHVQGTSSYQDVRISSAFALPTKFIMSITVYILILLLYLEGGREIVPLVDETVHYKHCKTFDPIA